MNRQEKLDTIAKLLRDRLYERFPGHKEAAAAAGLKWGTLRSYLDGQNLLSDENIPGIARAFGVDELTLIRIVYAGMTVAKWLPPEGKPAEAKTEITYGEKIQQLFEGNNVSAVRRQKCYDVCRLLCEGEDEE